MTKDSIPSLLIDRAGCRLSLIVESFQRLIGRPLLVDEGDIAESLWHAPFVIVAHGTEPDPLFFFGNKMALDLFEVSAVDFLAMPSRLSAEEGLRGERAQLMGRVTRDGYIDDYSGVRISATGRRFSIRNAIVWNLVDETNRVHGQAATFADWTPLD
jgi:hypothetical protein